MGTRVLSQQVKQPEHEADCSPQFCHSWEWMKQPHSSPICPYGIDRDCMLFSTPVKTDLAQNPAQLQLVHSWTLQRYEYSLWSHSGHCGQTTDNTQLTGDPGYGWIAAACCTGTWEQLVYAAAVRKSHALATLALKFTDVNSTGREQSWETHGNETTVLTNIMLLVKTNWVNERAATTPCAIMDYMKTPLLKPCKAHHTRQAMYWLLPASLLYPHLYQATSDRNRINPKYQHATSYVTLKWESHRMLQRNQTTKHFSSQKVQTYCAATTETNNTIKYYIH